jgi:hypothetical protein
VPIIKQKKENSKIILTPVFSYEKAMSCWVLKQLKIVVKMTSKTTIF